MAVLKHSTPLLPSYVVESATISGIPTGVSCKCRHHSFQSYHSDEREKFYIRSDSVLPSNLQERLNTGSVTCPDKHKLWVTRSTKFILLAKSDIQPPTFVPSSHSFHPKHIDPVDLARDTGRLRRSKWLSVEMSC